MAWKKVFRKQKKNVGRYIKKRYFKGGNVSDPKLKTMFRDVMRLKNMVNAEKKNIDSADTANYLVAQNNGAGTGSRCIDVTPVIAQGVSEDQRNGDSLKVCSYCLQTEVSSNSFNTLQNTKYQFFLIRQPTNPLATGNTLAAFFEDNTFSGVVDYNSNRNYQNFKDFVVMRTWKGIIKQNTNDSNNQVQKANHKVYGKCDFHIRYSKGTTTILNNPIYLIAVADAGDIAGTNHIFFKWSMKLYFYDN